MGSQKTWLPGHTQPEHILAKLSNLLDDVQIRHWLSKREPAAKSGGDGLTFTLSAAGSATWVLRYRYGGRRKELTLGNYPDISLAAARKLAREHRVAVDQGGDPATAKQEAKSRARDASRTPSKRSIRRPPFSCASFTWCAIA